MTRLVADAKAGQLANAVVDEANLVVQATYGPGVRSDSGPATDGGTLKSGAVADASVLGVYLPKIVDTLIAAGVPVHPGTITGSAVVAADPATPDTAANASAAGNTQAATTASASAATGGVPLGPGHRPAGLADRIARDRHRVVLAQAPLTSRRAQ